MTTHLGKDHIKGLQGKISGYAIPNYVVDTPSGKVPLSHNYVLGKEKNSLLLEDLHGQIWKEDFAF